MLVNTKMQNDKCKMTNAKWGESPIGHFAFCIEHFAFCILRTTGSRRSAPRFGISLTEVLISMGILTLGLLGVAALFPVGGFYMQKAENSDRGSAIAQSVMSDIATNGMLNPRSWYVMVPPGNWGIPANKRFASDGALSPTFPSVVPASYSRPFGSALAEALLQPQAAIDPTLIGKQFGSAFVIDPMGVAAMSFSPPPPNPNPQRQGPVAVFPGAIYSQYGALYNSTWNPWAGIVWPVRRVTFRQPNTGWHLDATMAEYYCRAPDDLVTDLPERDDRPATQNWTLSDFDNDGVPDPLARQWTGDYSWLATVVPTTNAARDGMARNPEGHAYDVSVVVFYKRVLPPTPESIHGTMPTNQAFYNGMSSNERAVKAIVLSTGLNGGELLLEDLKDNPSENAFQHLKTGNWIMLCGPHPNSSTSDPKFSLNWYQVLAIEGRDRRLNGQGTETPPPGSADPVRRVVTVRGSQWPWVPGTTTSTNLCVAICRGAVAVHTKTMRLEKNGTVTFGAAGTITKTPYPWTTY